MSCQRGRVDGTKVCQNAFKNVCSLLKVTPLLQNRNRLSDSKARMSDPSADQRHVLEPPPRRLTI